MVYKRKARVLFLCTGHACRSQMAEGWARQLGGDWIEARSAGIGALGPNPRAIAVMREAGVDISGQASIRVTPPMLAWADLVVTVCGHADEHCPALPPHVRKKHAPFDDPARATGSEEEIMATFRSVRDAIRAEIESMIGGLRMMARTDER